MAANGECREIYLRVEGKPEGKDRPRFNPFQKRVYTTAKTTLGESEFRRAWEEQGKPRLPEDSALGLAVSIQVVRPQGHFKANGELSAQGLRHPIPRNKKPDLDNAIKLIMDALNSRAYADDVRIAKVECHRVWAEYQGTSVRLWVLDAQADEGPQEGDL